MQKPTTEEEDERRRKDEDVELIDDVPVEIPWEEGDPADRRRDPLRKPQS